MDLPLPMPPSSIPLVLILPLSTNARLPPQHAAALTIPFEHSRSSVFECLSSGSAPRLSVQAQPFMSHLDHSLLRTLCLFTALMLSIQVFPLNCVILSTKLASHLDCDLLTMTTHTAPLPCVIPSTIAYIQPQLVAFERNHSSPTSSILFQARVPSQPQSFEHKPGPTSISIADF